VEQALVLLGVVGMIDPPRLRHGGAGLRARPILITGDHPATAAAIAAELGIAAPDDRPLTGAELQRLDDAALRGAVRAVSVYARVAPEHKLRIVRALQANGQITAMTGDGVNDAPALEAADIGVAMGRAGTDVAKGAADMVLTDDDFASIVAAIEEGRAIFSNIQRFLRYLLSSNAGEVLVMFLGVVLGRAMGLAPGPGMGVAVPLLATQILWINLLTDAGPALALGVEPAARDVMQRPPRDPGRAVLAGRDWLDVLLVGLVMAAATLAVMDWALPGGLITGAPAHGGVPYARTLGVTTLVLAQLFNAFSARSTRRSAFHRLLSNRWLWLAALISVGLQVAAVHAPPLQRPFGTVPLSPLDWLRCTAAASAVLWAMELRKLLAGVRRRAVRGRPAAAISSDADGTHHPP
jgi:Ca2+-transporting ATPase